jgi:hypothetical protein
MPPGAAAAWVEAEDGDGPSASLAQVAFAAARGGRPRARWGAIAMLLLVSQAGTIAWLTLSDPPRPRGRPEPAARIARADPVPVAAPAPPVPQPAPFVVRALADPESMLVGSEAVTLRSGPSPEFPAVGNVEAGTAVLAGATARGPGDSSWLEIKAASGAIGFVPDAMLEADPEPIPALEPVAPMPIAPMKEVAAPKIGRAMAAKKAPAPKLERAVASKKPPVAKVERAAAAKKAAAPKVERAVASKKVPAPKVERAVASKKAPIPRIERAVASKKPSVARTERAARLAQRSRPAPVPAALGVDCILPGGEQIQATRTNCRARSGIIYQ